MNFSTNEELVEYLKRINAIKSKNIIKAFYEVDRKDFVNEKLQNLAYFEGALPIVDNSTISQPSIIGEMLEMLELKPKLKIFEIGTGSGYSTTLLAKACEECEITSVEIKEKVYEIAKKNIAKYNVKVNLILGDGKKCCEGQRFDRILINASTKKEELGIFIERLKEDGFIVCPLNKGGYDVLAKVTRNGKIREGKEVVFVKLE